MPAGGASQRQPHVLSAGNDATNWGPALARAVHFVMKKPPIAPRPVQSAAPAAWPILLPVDNAPAPAMRMAS